jgi:hypothetical protein
MMGDGIGLENLRSIVRSLVEASVDTGVADATSAVDHLDDSAKSWPVNAFTDLIIEITDGTGEGQIRKIASNTATSIVPVTNFDTAPDATSTYRIGFFGKMSGDITSWGGTALTGRDISAKGLGFSGAVYENENTATSDATRRFETTSKKLKDVIIQVETNDQLFGNASNQRFKVTAGASMGFTQVDLSTLYFKNAGAGLNGTVRIIGVED